MACQLEIGSHLWSIDSIGFIILAILEFIPQTTVPYTTNFKFLLLFNILYNVTIISYSPNYYFFINFF